MRDSAALLDATAGPAPGDPYWAPPPRRPFAAEVAADLGRLGHEVVTADSTGLTPEVGAAIGTVYQVATAWIMRYWIRRLRREPWIQRIPPVAAGAVPVRNSSSYGR